jgi:hypothetical protein
MALGQQLFAVLLLPLLGEVGEEQLVRITVADLVVQQLVALEQRAQVEGVLVPRQVLQHARAGELLVGALAQDQHRQALALGDDAFAGGVGEAPPLGFSWWMKRLWMIWSRSIVWA